MESKKLNDNINPYKSYIYSYPHKKSYRNFKKPIDLEKLWEKASKNDILLYIHIPFCSNKCGYCNLLSTTCFSSSRLDVYVDKLILEIKEYKKILNINMENQSYFSNVILGGGTPTILSVEQMKRLLTAIEKYLYVDFNKVFFSIETSPKTLSKEYIELLEEYKLNRVSVGIQSFRDNELLSIYRNELNEDINKVLSILFDSSSNNKIKIRNLDLIYGLPNQTLNTWKESLEKVISYNPEEIFIYPLYIREKTKLYNNYTRDYKLMENMYEIGVKILKENNYIQTSMRNFIHNSVKSFLYPEYSCQENEMIGIGCGARSYIGNIHYSRKYAVDDKNINKIIDDYLEESSFKIAEYGYRLSLEEQKIKYILKSILKVTGLDIEDYKNKFSEDLLEKFSEFKQLFNEKYLVLENNQIIPTEKGLKYSDYIGTLFISDDINKKIKEFVE